MCLLHFVSAVVFCLRTHKQFVAVVLVDTEQQHHMGQVHQGHMAQVHKDLGQVVVHHSLVGDMVQGQNYTGVVPLVDTAQNQHYLEVGDMEYRYAEGYMEADSL
jgi:hypothetical protein